MFDDDELEVSKEEGVEPWVASFADMMTLLLGFFMILYSMSHMDEKKFSELGKSISDSFKRGVKKEVKIVTEVIKEENQQIRAFQMLVSILNLKPEQAVSEIEDLYTAKVESQALKSMAKENIKQIKDMKDLYMGYQENLTGEVFDLIIPSKNLFVSGSAKLTQESEIKLVKIVSLAKELSKSAVIEIEGHTDSAPPGPSSYYKDNWELSAARATSVAKIFLAQGVPGNIMSVTGRSSYRPLFPEFDSKGKYIKENMERNRRIHVKIRRRSLKDR